jgi:DNA polymerase-3 subunit gamma/tau
MQERARAVPAAALEQVLDTLFREEPAVRLSPQPKLGFEMAVFRVLQARPAMSIDALIAKLDDLRREVGGGAPDPGARAAAPQPPRPAGATAVPEASDPAPADPAARWQLVADEVARSQPNLGANLKRCRLKSAGRERVELVAATAYVASLLRRDKNLALVRAACARLFEGTPEIVVEEEGESGPPANGRRERNQAVVQETLNHPLVAEAIDVFNGKLVDVHIPEDTP